MTGHIQKVAAGMPDWLKVTLGVAVSLGIYSLTFASNYGNLSARVAALEIAIQASAADRAALHQGLSHIRETNAAVSVTLASLVSDLRDLKIDLERHLREGKSSPQHGD